MQLTIIFALLGAIASVVFAMQNNVPVTVNFLLWRFDSSIAMVLMVALAIGACIVALLSTPATLKRQWLLSKQKRKIDELETSCANLRNRVAELEAHLPSDLAAEPPPYVGLKQIILGKGSDPSDGP